VTSPSLAGDPKENIIEYLKINVPMMPINPKTVDAPNVRELLKKGAVLLDVRTHEEFVGCHLPHAINIPIEDLLQQLPVIRSWQRPVVVYSADDQRSRRALVKLHNHGIPSVDAGSLEALRPRLAGI